MRFAGLRWPADEAGAAGPVTVFLHGFLDHAGAWEGVAELLPGERVAVDHRGHGRSQHNPPGASYFFADYLADLDVLLDALSPTRPVRLVGHSMGGTIATLYAGARPQRVASVVSLDGLGLHDGGDEVVVRMEQFLDGAKKPPRNRPMPSVRAAADRILRDHPRVGADWANRLAERGTVPVEGGVTWSFDPLHRARSPVPYRHGHHLPLLARIQAPVLALRPEFPVFAADDVAKLEAAVPTLTAVTIPGTGHSMHQEAPGMIAREIRSFWVATAGTG